MSSERVVLFPKLTFTKKRRGVLIENPLTGTTLLARDGAMDMIEFLRRPRTIAAVIRRFDMTHADVSELLDRYVLVRENELDILSGGLCTKPWKQIGEHVRPGELAQHPKGAYVVLGAPVDIAGKSGPRNGPNEVREHFPNRLLPNANAEARLDIDFRRIYETPGTPVLDVGDLVVHGGEGAEAYSLRLRHMISNLLRLGMIPVTVGGDHSITGVILDVVLETFPAVGVLHFDAHHDMYTSPGKRRLTHANPFDYALDHKSLRHLRQFGLRTMERREVGTKPILDPRLSFWTSRELQHMSPMDALAHLPTDIPYYLSFDVDCMDPIIAPCTGTPVQGGLTYYQALDLLDCAYQRFTFVGADFVEVSRSDRKVNHAAHLVGNLMARLFVSKDPHTLLETCLYR